MKRALVIALLLTGCGFLARTKNAYYSLETVPGTVVNATGTPIGIDAIELPPGIDRREIVVRGANHSLDVRPNELWSASLKEMVTHTLAFDLARRLPEGMVVLPGQAKPAAMRPLSIVFEDFAVGPDRELILDARWSAAAPGGATHHERVTIPVPSTDTAAIVTAMSNALGTLADRIVGGM